MASRQRKISSNTDTPGEKLLHSAYRKEEIKVGYFLKCILKALDRIYVSLEAAVCRLHSVTTVTCTDVL